MDSRSALEKLIDQAASGDELAACELFSRYRERLTRIVQLRLDRRLYGRLDASDVVQEATIEASRRLAEYARTQPMGFFLWMRQLATQKLIDAHRHHLGTQKRDVSQEVSLYRQAIPEATSTALAAQLLGRLTTPTAAAVRAELQIHIQDVLNSLDPIHREVLVLRHFEHLSNSETAETLGISKSAASKRFIVAIRRLKDCLKKMPGLADRL